MDGRDLGGGPRLCASAHRVPVAALACTSAAVPVAPIVVCPSEERLHLNVSLSTRVRFSLHNTPHVTELVIQPDGRPHTGYPVLSPSSTLLDSSTRELNRPRQTSTPRRMRGRMQSGSTGSTATRQLLDSYLTGSTGKALTAPRQRPRQRLDGASTARQLDSQGSKPQTRTATRGVADTRLAVRRVVEAVVCVGTSTHHRTRDSLCGQRLVLTWLDMTRLPRCF